VTSVELTGSRARGEETELSDWDFAVATDAFDELAADLPAVVAELKPLAGQWDRLSEWRCYMLTLRGPVKVDFIFDEPQTPLPPWEVRADTLEGVDMHLWDWALWLAAKALRGRDDLVAAELARMWEHILRPAGVEEPPGTLADAVRAYLGARSALETRLGVEVPRALEREVAPVVWRVSS
jgi:hypothetical protein